MFSSIDTSWEAFVQKESEKEYFKKLSQFLETEYKTKTIYPKAENIFSAFNFTPFHSIKAVIIGQDPYHGENQAHGLSFSVPVSQKKIPPSLKNIFKEINAEYPENKNSIQNNNRSGNLEYLAKQGVFLLNATLTVEAKKAGSHQKKGWEIFTDSVISHISEEHKNIVFILWGNFAQKKQTLINTKKHYIINAPHPSPLSAYRGFFGSNCFRETNKILKNCNITPIQW